MRILEINKFNFVQGGADKYYLDITEDLKKAGHEVANFCVSHEKNLKSDYDKYFVSPLDFSMSNGAFGEIKNGFKIVGRTLWSFEAAKKIEQLILDFKPDVAHIHTIYHQLSPSILSVLKKHKIPVVMTVHDFGLISCNYVRYHHGKLCSHTINGNFWKAIAYKCVKDSYLASALEALTFYFHKQINIYKKSIDYIIFPSIFHASEHEKAGFSVSQSQVVNNYFEADKYKANYKTGNYIFFIGRIFPEKGLDTLISAYSKSSTKLKLVIGGDGPELEKMKKLAKDLKVNAKFLGYMKNSDVLKYISNSAFTVFPSRALENQPLVVLESMALGKPVIASKNGGTPEIITGKVDGLLFEAGNIDELAEKITALSSSKKNIVAMGRKARSTVKNRYNKKRHLEKLTTIFELLAKNYN